MANEFIVVEFKNADEMKKAFKEFPSGANRAMYSTLKRAESRVVTQTAKEVQGSYKMQRRKDVKDKITLKRASRNTLQSTIEVKDSPMKISKFPYRIGGNGYATVEIKRGAKKPSKLFLKDSKYGGKELFKNQNGELKVGYTLSVPQMVGNEKVINAIMTDASNFIEDRFLNHELPYVVGKLIERGNKV